MCHMSKIFLYIQLTQQQANLCLSKTDNTFHKQR